MTEAFFLLANSQYLNLKIKYQHWFSRETISHVTTLAVSICIIPNDIRSFRKSFALFCENFLFIRE